MNFIKLTLENTGNKTFVNAEKITDFQINSKVAIIGGQRAKAELKKSLNNLEIHIKDI